MAVRLGAWKAHWVTFPGLSGCPQVECKRRDYDPPLIFNVERDPSEAFPLLTGTPEHTAALSALPGVRPYAQIRVAISRSALRRDTSRITELPPPQASRRAATSY